MEHNTRLGTEWNTTLDWVQNGTQHRLGTGWNTTEDWVRNGTQHKSRGSPHLLLVADTLLSKAGGARSKRGGQGLPGPGCLAGQGHGGVGPSHARGRGLCTALGVINAPQPSVTAFLLYRAEEIVFPLTTLVRVCQLEGKMALLRVGVFWSLLGRVAENHNAVSVGLAVFLLIEVHERSRKDAVSDLPGLLVLPTQLLQVAPALDVVQLGHFHLLWFGCAYIVLPYGGLIGRCLRCNIHASLHVDCARAAVLRRGRGSGGGCGHLCEGRGEHGLLVGALHLLLGLLRIWGQHSLDWGRRSERQYSMCSTMCIHSTICTHSTICAHNILEQGPLYVWGTQHHSQALLPSACIY